MLHISKKYRKGLKFAGAIMLLLLAVYAVLPTKIQNPVEGFADEGYDSLAFWHRWGDHYHRGIDIFADRGTPVHPAIGGIVTMVGHNRRFGGNCVEILSSGFRLHYYAHMDTVTAHLGTFVTKESVIGTIGNTGNAAGKPYHLHYSIASVLPLGDWRFDKKMFSFYINPITELKRTYR